MHFINDIPQSGMTNTSYFPDYSFAMGIPFFGSYYFDVSSNLSLDNAIYEIDNKVAFDVYQKWKMPDMN